MMGSGHGMVSYKIGSQVKCYRCMGNWFVSSMNDLGKQATRSYASVITGA